MRLHQSKHQIIIVHTFVQHAAQKLKLRTGKVHKIFVQISMNLSHFNVCKFVAKETHNRNIDKHPQ